MVGVLNSIKSLKSPGGGGDSHMKQTGMLVGNFDLKP